LKHTIDTKLGDGIVGVRCDGKALTRHRHWTVTDPLGVMLPPATTVAVIVWLITGVAVTVISK
jgi:hypothetical protein